METFSVIPSPKVSDTVVEPHLACHNRDTSESECIFFELNVIANGIACHSSKEGVCFMNRINVMFVPRAHEVQRCPELSPVGGELR